MQFNQEMNRVLFSSPASLNPTDIITFTIEVMNSSTKLYFVPLLSLATYLNHTQYYLYNGSNEFLDNVVLQEIWPEMVHKID